MKYLEKHSTIRNYLAGIFLAMHMFNSVPETIYGSSQTAKPAYSSKQSNKESDKREEKLSYEFNEAIIDSKGNIELIRFMESSEIYVPAIIAENGEIKKDSSRQKIKGFFYSSSGKKKEISEQKPDSKKPGKITVLRRMNGTIDRLVEGMDENNLYPVNECNKCQNYHDDKNREYPSGLFKSSKGEKIFIEGNKTKKRGIDDLMKELLLKDIN